MIKILKAEYSYLYYGSYHTILILIGLAIVYNTMDVIIINRLVFMIGLMLVLHLIGNRKKEYRSCFESKLPVTFKTLAITRLIMIAFPIIILYAIGICINLYYLGFI